jgi:peptidyl-prolyl cis-trans isomerase C
MVRLLPLTFALLLASCETRSPGPTSAPPEKPVLSRKDLPEEHAKAVLAKVGDRTITLGDYVSALERMDRFERLRYQTPERRKLLLDEMIEMELLAREAERIGLDKEPETRAYLQQLMREEVLRELRDKAPRPEEVPAADVAAYYAAHPDDFVDPERRRVAVIALGDAKTAQEVLDQVREADAKRWGEVARERSLLKGPAKSSAEAARPPLEFEGDLGLTAATKDERGRNPSVPAEVNEALFRIDEAGKVFPEVVASGGRFYVVRLLAKSPARKRLLEEAETVIRAKLVQLEIAKAEAALKAELAKKYPVEIDDAALAAVQIPKGGPGRAPDVGSIAPTSAAPAPKPSSTAP